MKACSDLLKVVKIFSSNRRRWTCARVYVSDTCVNHLSVDTDVTILYDAADYHELNLHHVKVSR